MEEDALIAARHKALEGILDERQRRLHAAVEAKVLGRGGVKRVSQATGVARGSILSGIKELESPERPLFGQPRRIRRAGAGRKRLVDLDPGVREALEQLLEPAHLNPAFGSDPPPPLRWTCKSLVQLAHELGEKGHTISHVSVGVLLKELGYSLQSHRKTLSGAGHPDRNAQFEYIYNKAQAALNAGQPVISVEIGKKEIASADKNCASCGISKVNLSPSQCSVHVDEQLEPSSPHGDYDFSCNAKWVNMIADHNTVSLAVATIRRWWFAMGQTSYSAARELLIVAGGSGSNGSQVQLWKLELQRLANELEIPVRVSHFPSGTSKWSRIDQRLSSCIRMNWSSQPMMSHEVIIHSIAVPTSCKDLEKCVTEFTTARMNDASLDDEWNYAISPDQ
jgi:transposase